MMLEKDPIHLNTHSLTRTHTTAAPAEKKAAQDLVGETVSGVQCTEWMCAISLLLVQLACVVMNGSHFV